MTDPTEQHILAVRFDKPTRADEALLALLHVQQEGGIELADAVVVAKTPEGRTIVRQTVDITPGRGALTGAIALAYPLARFRRWPAVSAATVSRAGVARCRRRGRRAARRRSPCRRRSGGSRAAPAA